MVAHVCSPGVVLFELGTGGRIPHSDAAPAEVSSLYRQGKRGAWPWQHRAPDSYRQLADKCWATESSKRMPAYQIVDFIQNTNSADSDIEI